MAALRYFRWARQQDKLYQQVYCVIVSLWDSHKSIRVENKASSAGKMGCCFLDEGIRFRGFIFAFAAYLM